MRRHHKAAIAIVAAAITCAAAARADYFIPVPATGATALVFAFVCTFGPVSKQCPTHVNIDSSGAEKAVLANPFIDKSIIIDSTGAEKATLGNPLFAKSVPIDGTGAALGTAANPFRTSAVAKAPLGFQSLSSLSSSTGLTVPGGATTARVCVEYQPVRYRDDGTAPTATVGMPLVPALAIVPVQPSCFDYNGDLTAIRFIQQQAGAVVDVSYYK